MVTINVFVTFYIEVTSNCIGTVTPEIRERITCHSLHVFLKKLLPYFLLAKKIMLCNISFVHFFRNCSNISNRIKK